VSDAGAGGTGGGGTGGSSTPASAIEILARPPFIPRQPELFAGSAYPTAAAAKLAPGPGLDPAGARALLVDVLGKRAGQPAGVAAATAALFDDGAFAQRISEPALRAAVLLLRGTAGEAAIDAITSGSFVAVGFAAPPPYVGDSPAWVEDVGGKGAIRVADWARFEDPRALASVLAHETLHSDTDVQSKEETICAALEAIIYGQLLRETPALARAGTRLAAYNNLRLLERLNSRDETGALRLTYSSGPTLPGSVTGYGFFMEFYEPFFARATAGNPTLQAFVRAVTGSTPTGGFDNALVELLDRAEVALSPDDLVQLAIALDLDQSPPAPFAIPARPPAPVAALAPPPADAEAQALRVLQQPPFTPRNPALFDSAAYPGAADVPAAAPGPDAAAVRRVLETTLMRRLGGNDARIPAALGAFDTGALTRAIPSPSLRAALLLLRGTAGDTVVEAFATGALAALDFNDTQPELPMSTVLHPLQGGPPRLVLNGTLRFEDPRLLAPWIVEAALHDDAVKTPKELLLGRAVLPLIYGQLLLESPEVAKAGTRLSRILNRVLLGRLNSRGADGKLRLLQATGNIFPGSAGTLASYLGIYIPFGPDTPGGRTLSDVMNALTGSNDFTGPFSVATIRLLDDHQALLSATQIVTLLRTLETNVP
jgi:hypothetical protein